MRFRAWFFIVTEGVQSIWNPGNQEKISGFLIHFVFMNAPNDQLSDTCKVYVSGQIHTNALASIPVMSSAAETSLSISPRI